ncbi:MAG: AAA family ATPase [Bacteroidia bacterium]
MIKIAVTGPESTGKSSICKIFGEKHDAMVVPEFARTWLESRPNYRYTFEDVEWMAQEQFRLQSEALQGSSALVICDTDLLVFRIWMEVVFGKCPKWIKAESERNVFDFTLLMDIDLAWKADPLREHPHLREELFFRYLNLLENSGRPFGVVSGKTEERYQNSLTLLKEHSLFLTP